ncbi:MAG: hypothetical protein M1821_001879 [Bathelium mastoideum]|nr:MAG: hypothetical protein M1821_001879 [Bathelium mastoideum]KAI9692391.1 MAG: hypothetical protein M1822_006622 [Bathelium mastoideum]
MAAEPARLAAQDIVIGGGSASQDAKATANGAVDTPTVDGEGHDIENADNTPEEDMDAEGDTDAEAANEGGEEDEDEADAADDDAVESDENVEAQMEDGEEDEDAYEDVGALKLRKRKRPLRRGDEEEEADVSNGGSSEESANDSDESGSSESESENEWEAESDEEDDVATEAADPNSCWFCKQTEENDPSEEYEEYLACAICGDNAHRQCARDASALQPDEDAKHWRCPTCVENGLEEETTSDGRRRSSPLNTRMQKDLLPSHRGSSKPNSHSVFNTLILDDDPMDGSRSLRKRKSSDDTDEALAPATRKRRRKSDTVASVDELASPGSGPSTIHVASHRNGDSVDVAHDSEAEGSEPVRSARLRRSRKVDKSLTRIVKSNNSTLVLAFHLDASRLSKILSSKPKKKRIRDRSRKTQLPPPEPEVSHYPAIQTTNWAAALYSFNDKENDELRTKPYGGILSEPDADTSKTFPMAADRKRFEEARQKAEEDWKKKIQAVNALEPSRPSQKMSGPPSKIKCINFGGYEIDTWHAAPYPEEYSRNRLLYICEFCLKYMNSDYVAWRHKLKCPAKHPPGDEIYRDGTFSFFEVDGRKNPVYCQNLCLLAKLFLGSKTLYYDVEPFLFYIMTENDDFGCHFVGYFSKEKRPSSQNNVSCILVLPIHQRRGFGHLLIEFSYLLTRVEKKTGSPEKPLSDMGLVSYRSYWRLILCYQLRKQRQPLSIVQLSERTGMTADDIVSALEGLRALVRDPVTKTYALRLDYPFLDDYVENYEKKGYIKLNPDALLWTPYVMGRGNLATYEQGPALQTVAPREGDGDTTKAPEEGVQMANGVGHDHAIAIDNIKAAKLDPEHSLQASDPAELLDGSTQPRDDDASDARPTITPQHSFSGPRTPGLYVNGSSSLTDAPTPALSAPPPPPTIINTAVPSTPTSANNIPPTRFEVFPPIPGATSRRRAGRPFARSSAAASTSRHTGTPVRRTSDRLAAETAHGAAATAAAAATADSLASPARRTRSKLADLVNGTGTGEGFVAVEADHSASGGEVGDGEQQQADQQGGPDPMAGRDADGDDDATMEDV